MTTAGDLPDKYADPDQGWDCWAKYDGAGHLLMVQGGGRTMARVAKLPEVQAAIAAVCAEGFPQEDNVVLEVEGLQVFVDLTLLAGRPVGYEIHVGSVD